MYVHAHVIQRFASPQVIFNPIFASCFSLVYGFVPRKEKFLGFVSVKVVTCVHSTTSRFFVTNTSFLWCSLNCYISTNQQHMTSTRKINGCFQRFCNGCLCQITTGTPTEQCLFIIRVPDYYWDSDGAMLIYYKSPRLLLGLRRSNAYLL